MAVTSYVRITSRFAAVAAEEIDRAARAIAATGRDMAQSAKDGMTPNHFLDSGLSQETTQWTQTSHEGGAVQIPTEYAAFPEYGTVRMDPRPVLTPAIDQHWPATVLKHWAESSLEPIGSIEPLLAPIAKPK